MTLAHALWHVCIHIFTHKRAHTHPLVTKLHSHFPFFFSRAGPEGSGVVTELIQQGLMLGHPSPTADMLLLLAEELAAAGLGSGYIRGEAAVLEGAVLACADDTLTNTLISLHTVPGFHFSQ